MSEILTIRGLIERVLSGTIRIPKFQRGFVWEAENVAFLMDSVYRGYPIGSVLFWRTTQQLTSERDLGPFKLPEPSKKWPIDYVLDGQQRLTSLFGVFQTFLQPTQKTDNFEIFFDVNAPEGALEEQFVAYPSNEDVSPHYFPLRLIFDPTPFALKTRELASEPLKRVVELQRRFQETQLKNDIIEFDDREQIAMIFERVNRAGVPLDAFQLLTAWTWSEEFDLNERIDNLGAEVASHGFSRIGEQQDLLLKCSAAVVAGDASVKSIIALHGPTVRSRFDDIARGIYGAIEFLRAELNVHSLEIMPFPAMLVPLTRFFATSTTSGFHPSAKQRKTLVEWFWRACFSRRYSSGVNRAYESDIKFMDALKENENTPIGFRGDAGYGNFLHTDFNIGSANTKTFVLMLATMKPKSLISNSSIDLEDTLLRCNRNEFHHLFPKNYLVSTLDEKKEANGLAFKNSLVNFCFLSSADNQKIKDKSPASYVKLIPEKNREQAFDDALLPDNWHEMNFVEFLRARSDTLAARADFLCGTSD